MALRLVIAEKPSVAQTIAAALGIKGKQDGYIVDLQIRCISSMQIRCA